MPARWTSAFVEKPFFLLKPESSRFGPNEWCALKNALSYGFRGQGKATNMVKTHKNNVRRFAAICSDFASATFRCFPRRSQFLCGMLWKIAENRTLKWGSSPPRAEEKLVCRISGADRPIGRIRGQRPREERIRRKQHFFWFFYGPLHMASVDSFSGGGYSGGNQCIHHHSCRRTRGNGKPDEVG
jgi:hypothetical protein